MTFKLVTISNAQEKVVGTIWAEAEAQAQLLASNLFGGGDGSVVLRRAEDREIPMRLAESNFASPFLT